MAGYCATTDLLVGDIPLPTYIDPQKKVDDASDEIDSYLGYLYETPIDVSTTGPLARPARLLLKRINASLASGRIILAVASPEENRNLHAYGWSLVTEALTALTALAKGEPVLEGAIPAPNAAAEAVTVPLINNLDSESNVEAFYNRISNPAYSYLPPVTYNYPDRLVD